MFFTLNKRMKLIPDQQTMNNLKLTKQRYSQGGQFNNLLFTRTQIIRILINMNAALSPLKSFCSLLRAAEEEVFLSFFFKYNLGS